MAASAPASTRRRSASGEHPPPQRLRQAKAQEVHRAGPRQVAVGQVFVRFGEDRGHAFALRVHVMRGEAELRQLAGALRRVGQLDQQRGRPLRLAGHEKGVGVDLVLNRRGIGDALGAHDFGDLVAHRQRVLELQAHRGTERHGARTPVRHQLAALHPCSCSCISPSARSRPARLGVSTKTQRLPVRLQWSLTRQ
jgi:hypothetical protein